MEPSDTDHPPVSGQPDASQPPPRRAWDLQAGEPLEAYAKFETYLGLGPGRTLRKAQELFTGKPLKASNSLSSVWKALAKRWKWDDRVAAWTAAEAQKKVVDLESRNTALRNASANTFAAVAEALERVATAENVLDDRHRNDIVKLKLIDKVNGGAFLVNANRTQFGDRSKIQLETKVVRLEFGPVD